MRVTSLERGGSLLRVRVNIGAGAPGTREINQTLPSVGILHGNLIKA